MAKKKANKLKAIDKANTAANEAVFNMPKKGKKNGKRK